MNWIPIIGLILITIEAQRDFNDWAKHPTEYKALKSLDSSRMAIKIIIYNWFLVMIYVTIRFILN